MKQSDKDAIIQRYRDRLESHGQNIKALASGNEDRRAIRFKILSEIGDLQGTRILDYGCGLSDFYAYLRDRNISCTYTGIDIVPEFVNSSKARFPENSYLCLDLQEENPFEKGNFDFIFCSQVFNNKLAEEPNETLIADMIPRLFQLATQGLAIDFVTKYVDYQEPHLNYYDPEKLFAFAKTLTKRVTLRHDYPLFEFCLFIYSDFSGWAGRK